MMTRRRMMMFGRVAMMAAGPLLFAGTVCRAQVAEAALPDGRAVLERYRTALGASAFEGRMSMQASGQFVMDGVAAEFDTWAARPDRSAMRIRIPGVGEIRSGYVDGTGWSLDPFSGPHVMEGAELVRARDDAAFGSFTRDSALLDGVTTVERTRLGSYDCVKVRLRWKSGRETFDCYSTETGLLVGTTFTQGPAAGEFATVMVYEDYRDVEGVKIPMKVTVQARGAEQVVTLTRVTFDDVAVAAFDIPPAVREVMKRPPFGAR